MKKIILTGGGTAGHVTPNLALVPALKQAGYKIYYIGSKKGMEKALVEAAGITYYGISSGKLRRYKSLKNVTDLFRVCKGLTDAIRILRKIKPDVVFSKGGFVVVPVIAAAKLLKIKSVIHESDMTPGLANKLAMPFATKVCASFPETLPHLKGKGVLTGTPLRAELFKGSREKGLKVFDTPDQRPTLLVTGGSLGAGAINQCVREALPQILEKFRVIHLCGKGNLSHLNQPGYVEFEYVTGDMANVLAAADVVVSRAGANTIFELAALAKPHLLIPLPLEVSRGDQIQNAQSFLDRGFSALLPESEMTPIRLVADLNQLYQNRQDYIAKMLEENMRDGVKNILDIIQEI